MTCRNVPAAALAVVLVLTTAAPARAQRLLEEWRLRPTAGPEALATGASAVFWNPARVAVAGRGEATVMDLRAPGITGVDGLAAAVAYALDDRTVLGLGYEFMGVTGIQRTTTSPNGGTEIDLAENRVALAAAHRVGERVRVGALVQYTRLPEVSPDESVIAIGAGVEVRVPLRIPAHAAAMAATEGDAAYWSAGVEIASPRRWSEWLLSGEYGASGGQLAPGVTHRAAAVAEWREHVELSFGAALEPDGLSRSLEPVAGAEVRLQRYRLGMVREQLPNEFGGAWSFRFSVVF